jgi:hypothetical protein
MNAASSRRIAWAADGPAPRVAVRAAFDLPARFVVFFAFALAMGCPPVVRT